MWRQGGGASPHFALAIGEVMLRVGQRHIAWSAYERAARLADRHGAEPEETLSHGQDPNHRRPDWQNDGLPPLSVEEVADLRPRFEAELAYGEGYQRAYQEFEDKQIAAGVPITDEHFFDSFNAGREPIASPVGNEEWYVWGPPAKLSDYTKQRMWAWGAFGAGSAALLMAVFLRWRDGRRARAALGSPRDR
jgi:hypothetical protein